MAADPVVSPADTPDDRYRLLAGAIKFLPLRWKEYGATEWTTRDEAFDAMAALLAVGQRSRSGDPSLDPEEWYAIRDYAQKVLKDGGGAALRESRERDRQQIARLTEALERLEPLQQRVLGIIERNGFVFRTPLGKPDNERTDAERWEKLAFTLYSELCEADTVIRAVLAGEEDAP